jgi:glyoxylase-like metal-dependent hydrolase (beta-lactamase superfamily II)
LEKNKVKLYYHYCPFGFSNCYLIGDNETGTNDAIIIDPGNMDKQILDCIERNNFKIKGVLITHDHLGHVRGLRTLKRVYDTEIYAVNRIVQEHKTRTVKDGDKITIGVFQIEVISILGHSSDSVVYKIGTLLFTGDVLTAGLVGSTASVYGSTLQINNLRSRILSMPGDYTLLPGHGPPSSLEAERRFNAGISQYEKNLNKRPTFRVNF